MKIVLVICTQTTNTCSTRHEDWIRVNWIDHGLQLPACAVLAAGIRFL
jgi:hypothetical protein